MKPIARLSLMVGLALSACTANPSTPIALPLTPAPPRADTLDQAEAQWLSLNIRDYDIQVQTVSLWRLQTQEVVVRDGEVAESSATCITAPLEFGRECTVQAFEAADFTVPGLRPAAKAWTLAGEQWAAVAFDPTLYFPDSIGFNNPEIYDEEWGWDVLAFEAGGG